MRAEQWTDSCGLPSCKLSDRHAFPVLNCSFKRQSQQIIIPRWAAAGSAPSALSSTIYYISNHLQIDLCCRCCSCCKFLLPSKACCQPDSSAIDLENDKKVGSSVPESRKALVQRAVLGALLRPKCPNLKQIDPQSEFTDACEIYVITRTTENLGVATNLVCPSWCHVMF